jgi:hypothetical protein
MYSVMSLPSTRILPTLTSLALTSTGLGVIEDAGGDDSGAPVDGGDDSGADVPGIADPVSDGDGCAYPPPPDEGTAL